MPEIAGLPQSIVFYGGGGTLFVLLLLFSESFTDLLSYLFIKLVTLLAVCHLGDYLCRHRHTLLRPATAAVPQIQSFLQWTRRMDGTELRAGNVDLGWPCPPGCTQPPTVLITGAAFGLGKEMAHRYAAMGYKLVLWDIQAEPLEGVQAEIKLKYPTVPDVQTAVVDVSDADEVSRRASALGYRGVDILILNAGIVCGKKITDTTPDGVERVFKVNGFQHFNAGRAFVPLMKEEGVERRIVIVGSVAGFAGVANMADYNGSKAAANTFAEALGCELVGTNINVTLVCPNHINTGMFPGFKPLPTIPSLEPNDVVDEIIDAVRYRKRWIVLPWRILVIPVAKYVAPWSLFPWIDWALGASRAMDNFKGSTNAAQKNKNL